MKTKESRTRLDEKCFSIPDAANRLGLDSFTVYALIQRNKLQPKRRRWGEFMVAASEIKRILKPPPAKNNTKARTVC